MFPGGMVRSMPKNRHTRRKKLTLDSGMVTDNFLAFPVLVSMTDGDLVGNTQGDGGDILFTTDNGTTKLDHEIESYDSGTGSWWRGLR